MADSPPSEASLATATAILKTTSLSGAEYQATRRLIAQALDDTRAAERRSIVRSGKARIIGAHGKDCVALSAFIDSQDYEKAARAGLDLKAALNLADAFAVAGIPGYHRGTGADANRCVKIDDGVEVPTTPPAPGAPVPSYLLHKVR